VGSTGRAEGVLDVAAEAERVDGVDAHLGERGLRVEFSGRPVQVVADPFGEPPLDVAWFRAAVSGGAHHGSPRRSVVLVGRCMTRQVDRRAW
jgi:hypothetical protein